MIIMAISALLIGALLSMRYKVLVLIPVLGIGLAAIVAAGLVDGAPFSSIGVASLLFAVCLQVGYIVGGVTRLLVVSCRSLVNKFHQKR